MSTPATIVRARLGPGAPPRAVHSIEPPLDAGIDPGEHYGAAVEDFVVVPPAQVGQVGQGWTWDGAAFTAPSTAIPPADLLDYASGRQDARLGDVWSFNVAASGQAAHVVTTRLDTKGQFARLKIQGWLQLNAATAGAQMPYSNVDYTATTLTVAEVDSLVEQAGALDTKSYAILNALEAAIRASPPTVTARAQVDAAFAALSV